MSDLYEVAFSGQIAEGADLQEVRANVGKIFKADDAKLAQLFSGKRIVIKKNIDRQTAMKYQQALHKAGAVCELVNLSVSVETVEAAPPPQTVEPATPEQPADAPRAATNADDTDYSGRDIPPAPKTVPLDISGDQIDDLGASIAPVGSILKEGEDEPVAPPSVPEALSVAPVGSDLGEHKDEKTPPPPDTGGLSIVDN